MKGTLDRPLRVLILEAYASGSHGRVIDLLKRFSTHNVESISLGPAHWTWLALTGHVEMSDMVRQHSLHLLPDVLMFSGAMSIGSLLAMLPAEYQRLPRIAYFHESQWSYPNVPDDPRPYFVQHLDAVRICDEVWFNSRFHLNNFWNTATSTAVHPRLRTIAARLNQARSDRSRVVYPPVTLDEPPDSSRRKPNEHVLLWNARWEHDKRPDRLIRLLDSMAASAGLVVLGAAGKSVSEIVEELGKHASDATVPGHFADRGSYEDALSGPGVVVSTADHEFFGVAVLESVLAGKVPVLPYALAYPETLPSAWFYVPGDQVDFARVVACALDARGGTLPMHRSDAQRFSPDDIVPVWDEHFSRLARDQIARP